MMAYRTVKAALVSILGAQSGGRFDVVGFRQQSKASDEQTGFRRKVRIFYTNGSFEKSKNKNMGAKAHDCEFSIELSASAGARVDMSVLDDPASTPQQKAAALASLQEAADLADNSMDELIDAVFNILFDATNVDLGLDVGVISNRWISSIQKDNVLERGDLIVSTANIKYSCRVVEYVQGAVPVVPSPAVIDSSIPVNTNTGAGVLI